MRRSPKPSAVRLRERRLPKSSTRRHTVPDQNWYQKPRRMGFPPDGNTVSGRSIAVRWGSSRLFDEGFLGVPAAFLKYYTLLELTAGEAMFVLQLMSFKWNEQAPFPSYKTLAQRMGITTE